MCEDKENFIMIDKIDLLDLKELRKNKVLELIIFFDNSSSINKINFTKIFDKIISSLNSNDIISIYSFNDKITKYYEKIHINSDNKIMISNLKTKINYNGCTDLGLIFKYMFKYKNNFKDRTVLIITDGIFNIGITDNKILKRLINNIVSILNIKKYYINVNNMLLTDTLYTFN